MSMSIEKMEVLKIGRQRFPVGKEQAHELKTLLTHAVEVFGACESGEHNWGAAWSISLDIELEDIDGITETITISGLELAEQMLELISGLA